MHLTVVPVVAKKEEAEFELFDAVMDSLNSKLNLQNGDVLVISSKYVSQAQGRVISLYETSPSTEGVSLSKKYKMKPKIAEIVLRESDFIFGGIAGFVIASADGIMAPNAGIDKSNAKDGTIILYPKNPYQTAEELRRKIFLDQMVHVGIIFVDSRLMPARVGTTGVAIACAGIEPVKDMRAKKDLNGSPLKVTFQAVVDNLASIANHEMGEGAESKPIAIVRNSGAKLTHRRINPEEMAISHDQCVYMRGLNANN